MSQGQSPAPSRPPLALAVAAWVFAAASCWVLLQMRGIVRWAAEAWTQDGLGRPWSWGWQWPAESIQALAVGAILWVILWGVGYGLVMALGPVRRALTTRTERGLTGVLLAALVMSLMNAAAGLAGGCSPKLFGILMALEALAALPGWVLFFKHGRSGANKTAPNFWLRRLAPWLPALAPLALVALPYALAPSVESDELRYHLAAPAQWLLAGRIHYLPWQAFSNFPMLGEMLFLQALALGGDGAAHLMHFGFLPLAMGWIGLIIARLSTPPRDARAHFSSSAWGAGLAYALMPSGLILAGWANIDHMVTAWTLGLVYLCGRSLVRPACTSALAVGLVAAGAVSLKYTLIPQTGALGLAWLALWTVRTRRPAAAAALAARTALVATLAGSFWYLKNIAWTGNPVYPFAWGIFGGGEWSATNAAVFTAKASLKGMHLGLQPAALNQLIEWLISPWTTTFYASQFENHFLGPLPLLAVGLLLVAAVAGLWTFKNNSSQPGARRVHWTARVWPPLALVMLWGLWFSAYQSNRMLLPTAGLLFALTGGVWRRWAAALGRAPRVALGVLYGLALALAGLYYLTTMLTPQEGAPTAKADAVATALGFQPRALYLTRQLGYYRAAGWLAKNAKPGEMALLVGDHRPMHYATPLVASDWFDTPQPIPWMRPGDTPAALTTRLRAAGVVYIVFNQGELAKYYRTDFLPRITPQQAPLFEALWTSPSLEQVFTDPAARVSVYRILP